MKRPLDDPGTDEADGWKDKNGGVGKPLSDELVGEGGEGSKRGRGGVEDVEEDERQPGEEGPA